jgi:hypothetical protein
VHQDVTPGNVIVLYTGQVKLVDFGVAKVRTSADAALVKGKAGYLAPELFEGAAADRRSDVWSLGVVLWESLVLRRLFAAKTEEETFERIRNGPIDPPSKFALAVTKDLDDVCMKALARNPTLRYQSARAMQDDLIAVLRHANWSGDSEPIARFMRTTFASQIAARQEVLRDLAAREDPRPEAIERMSAHDEDPAQGTPPTLEEVVAGAHGSAHRLLSRRNRGRLDRPLRERRGIRCRRVRLEPRRLQHSERLGLPESGIGPGDGDAGRRRRDAIALGHLARQRLVLARDRVRAEDPRLGRLRVLVRSRR